MAVNKKPLCFSNQPQIRVKSFQTYAQLLLDKYPSTFNLILNDGKRSGFYVRTADNFYKVGSLQIQSNVVPLSSDGLSPEEASQILVRWSDITDRPTTSPAMIDAAINNPNISEMGYKKEILSIQPSSPINMVGGTWYIISDGRTEDYQLILPSNQPHLTTIKVSVLTYRVAKISPSNACTINTNTTPMSITNGSFEFVFDANTNNWIAVR